MPRGEVAYNQFGLFSELECLILCHIEKMTWSNAVLNLHVVSLFDCAIKHASWLLQLPCLVEITISRCQLMEQLVDTTRLSANLYLRIGSCIFSSSEEAHLATITKAFLYH